MRNLYYVSTQNQAHRVTAGEALLNSIAPDGGLYVPEHIPHFEVDWETFSQLSYQEMAEKILALFFDDFSSEQLSDAINSAYRERFNHYQITPVRKVSDYYILELFHGPTVAYKDISMAILPYLFEAARANIMPDKQLILMLSSTGESGKAALEAFREFDNFRVLLFYPKDIMSSLQEKQLKVHQTYPKKVVSIINNFRETVKTLEHILLDQPLTQRLEEQHWHYSSLNAINIGRVIPQIVYYYYAYAQLIRQNEITIGELVDFSIPTGNGTNLLSAYYSRRMGLPIGELICVNNENNDLYQLFTTGEFELNRPTYHTLSPSLDVRLPRNFERILYYLLNEDAEHTKHHMDELKQTGRFKLDPEDYSNIDDFIATCITNAETKAQIRQTFENHIYLLDPHSAVAMAGMRKLRREGRLTHKQMVIATSSPYKFPYATLDALNIPVDGKTDRQILELTENILQYDLPESILESISTVDSHLYSITHQKLKPFLEQWFNKLV